MQPLFNYLSVKCIFFLPGTDKKKVTRGIVIGKVPSELGNASLVVVSMLGMELHVAVQVQHHHLYRDKFKLDAGL